MTSPRPFLFSPLQRGCLGYVGHSLPNFQTLDTRHPLPVFLRSSQTGPAALECSTFTTFLPFEPRHELQTGNRCKDPASRLGLLITPTHSTCLCADQIW